MNFLLHRQLVNPDGSFLFWCSVPLIPSEENVFVVAMCIRWDWFFYASLHYSSSVAGGLVQIESWKKLSESRRLPLLQKSLWSTLPRKSCIAPFLGFDWQSALIEANFIPCKKIVSSGLQPAALGAKRRSMHGSKAFEAAHPSWCGGEVDALFQAYEAW